MIKLIKSTFYHEKKTKAALTKFIKQADQLSFGKECEHFEQSFSKYQKRRHTIFVNSGSSANLALLQALLNTHLLKRGDPVGFSALTWSTNVMPIIQLGLKPIPVDVEIDTLNVSSHTLTKVLAKGKLKALFITNLLGFCDDLNEVARICKEKNILLIEDNCEALGSSYQRKKLGNFGFASTFSFYVGHHMSTIEGGAVCTDNEELAIALRIVRAHGWDRNLALKQQEKIRQKFRVNSTFYSRYTFYDLGFNLRPTEIAGFLGNFQLQFLPEIIKKRNQNFLDIAPYIYLQKEKFYPIRYDHMEFHSNFAIPIICRSAAIRDDLVKRCKDKVEIRPIVGGDMTQQPFFEKHVSGWKSFMRNANSKLIHEQGLYFGNNPELTKAEVIFLKQLFTK